MDTHGPHVGAGLAADPKDAEVPVGEVLEQLALVDCADAQLSLDRGDEGRALEEGSLEPLQLLLHALCLDGFVQAVDAHVLLTRALDNVRGDTFEHGSKDTSWFDTLLL